MEAQDYIEKYRMNQEFYKFNRDEFIKDLEKELLDKIKLSPHAHPKYGRVPYMVFRGFVNEISDKFKEISKLRKYPLNPKLWGYFYSSVVIPYREKNYPKIQNYLNNLDKQDKTKNG